MSRKVIWKANNVTGTLKWRDCETRVRFNVKCDRTGALRFSFLAIPLSTATFWLDKVFRSGGRYVERLTLDGKDISGQKIHTDYFYITGIRHKSSQRSYSIFLKGTTDWLEVSPQVGERNSDNKTSVRYRIAGMQGFGSLKSDCELGKIFLGAATTVNSYEELTGALLIEAETHPDDHNKWLKKCDEKSDMILEILSLAQDRRLRWAIREYRKKGMLTSILFVGPQSGVPPHHPIFSHLNLQPAVELAVKSYTNYMRTNLGMGFAIEYFLMRPRFQELRFIAAMTGLEHMLQCFLSKYSQGGIILSSAFKAALLPNLKFTLKQELSAHNIPISVDALNLLNIRLEQINLPSLRENLLNFLRHYEVPLAGISTTQITNLVKTRNALAHGRKYSKKPGSERLSDHLLILQELMRRIFLTILGYSGQRDSFLNGQASVDFPPR